MVTVVNSTHPQTGLAITAVRARRGKGVCVLQRVDSVGRWAQVGAATERGGWVDGACRREPWAPWLSLPLAAISGWEARAAPVGSGGLEGPGGPAAPEPGPGSPAEAGLDRGPGGPRTVAGSGGLGWPGDSGWALWGPGAPPPLSRTRACQQKQGWIKSLGARGLQQALWGWAL